VAIPLAPVVAVCVVVLPFGAVRVNVTLAPEAGVPPFVTVAVIETVLGGVKVLAFVETLTAREGDAITVALAVPVAVEDVLDALRFTA
jgi:hypothetical protein